MSGKVTILPLALVLLIVGTLTVAIEYGTSALLASNVILDIQNKAKGTLHLKKSFMISHENSTILPAKMRWNTESTISFDRLRTTGMLVYSVTHYDDSVGFLAAFSVSTNPHNPLSWFVAQNVTDVSKVGHDELHRIERAMNASNGVYRGMIPMGKNITFNVTNYQSTHKVEARLTKLDDLPMVTVIVTHIEESFDYYDVNPMQS